MNNWIKNDWIKNDGPKVVKGEVEIHNEGVNILGNAQRVGHAERKNVMKHVLDMQDRGYITDQEAEARLNAAQAAEKATDLRSLTVDLPAPFVSTNLIQRYDWDKTICWVPTLLSGVGLSAVLAVVPTAVLSSEHLFPHNAAALSVGIITMLLGIIGFFSCLGGMIVKS